MATTTWKTLRSKLPADVQERLRKQLAEDIAAMPLDKLRKARHLTQAAVAAKMNIEQGAVSKIEARSDMYISTLRNYVEALGGTLELRVDFPEGSVTNIDLIEKTA